MRSIKYNQAGFTITELMIAITIFAIILLVGSMTMIQVGKMYYKGINSARTQEITRTIIEDISRGAQFSTGSVSSVAIASHGGVGHRAYCAGGKRYTFIPNLRVVADSTLNTTDMTGPHGLWKDDFDPPGGVCTPINITTATVAGSVNGQEMLSENMRVAEFCVRKTNVAALTPAQTPTAGSLCEIDFNEPADAVSVVIRVAFGENDMLEFNADGLATNCLSAVAGAQWCAVSQLETQVFRRLN